MRMTDPLPELAVGGVLELELGVFRSESFIFESSHPPSLLRVGPVSYENSLSYFPKYQFIFFAKNLDVVQIQLVANFLVMFSCCREIVGNFCCMFLNTLFDSLLSFAYINLVTTPAWNVINNSSLIFNFGFVLWCNKDLT